jgi:hypothetical protein
MAAVGKVAVVRDEDLCDLRNNTSEVYGEYNNYSNFCDKPE